LARSPRGEIRLLCRQLAGQNSGKCSAGGAASRTSRDEWAHGAVQWPTGPHELCEARSSASQLVSWKGGCRNSEKAVMQPKKPADATGGIGCSLARGHITGIAPTRCGMCRSPMTRTSIPVGDVGSLIFVFSLYCELTFGGNPPKGFRAWVEDGKTGTAQAHWPCGCIADDNGGTVCARRQCVCTKLSLFGLCGVCSILCCFRPRATTHLADRSVGPHCQRKRPG
jgi:hypothetical protein